MDKLLEAHNIPKLNQDEIKRSTTNNESEVVILSKTNKTAGPYGITAEFHQNFKEELTPTLL